MPTRHGSEYPERGFDDEVFSIAQWCKANRFSLRTGKRILANEPGYGPPPDIVRLSPHRLGITRRANRKWQDARTQPSAKLTRKHPR
jgi:hypothetical protein